MTTRSKEEIEPVTENAGNEKPAAVEQEQPAPGTEKVEPAAEETTQEDTGDTSEEAEEAPADNAAKKANREAAKYRTQLRESEERYGALSTQRDNLVRQFVESKLPAGLSPKLFWKMCEPEEFMSDEGTVDFEEITRRSQELIKEFNLGAGYDPIPTAGKSPAKSKPDYSLSAAFSPKR